MKKVCHWFHCKPCSSRGLEPKHIYFHIYYVYTSCQAWILWFNSMSSATGWSTSYLYQLMTPGSKTNPCFIEWVLHDLPSPSQKILSIVFISSPINWATFLFAASKKVVTLFLNKSTGQGYFWPLFDPWHSLSTPQTCRVKLLDKFWVTATLPKAAGYPVHNQSGCGLCIKYESPKSDKW